MSGLSLYSLNQRITTVAARLNNSSTNLDVEEGRGIVYKNDDGSLRLIKNFVNCSILNNTLTSDVQPAFAPYTPYIFHSLNTSQLRPPPRNEFWNTDFTYSKFGSMLHIKGKMTGTNELTKNNQTLQEYVLLTEADHTRTEPYAYIDGDNDYVLFEATESDYTTKLFDGAGLEAHPVILETKLGTDTSSNPNGVYTRYQASELTKYGYGKFKNLAEIAKVMNPRTPFSESAMTINISLPAGPDNVSVISVSPFNSSQTFYTYMSLYGLTKHDLYVTVGDVYTTDFTINTSNMTITFLTMTPTEDIRIERVYKMIQMPHAPIGRVNAKMNNYKMASSDVLPNIDANNNTICPHSPSISGFIAPMGAYFPSTPHFWSRGDELFIDCKLEVPP